MSVELHDAHEFAWLTAPIRHTAAQDLHLAAKDSANSSCLSSPDRPHPPYGLHPAPPVDLSCVWIGVIEGKYERQAALHSLMVCPGPGSGGTIPWGGRGGG